MYLILITTFKHVIGVRTLDFGMAAKIFGFLPTCNLIIKIFSKKKKKKNLIIKIKWLATITITITITLIN